MWQLAQRPDVPQALLHRGYSYPSTRPCRPLNYNVSTCRACHRHPCQHSSRTLQSKRHTRVASAENDELHETKLGPNVAAGIKDVKESLTWSTATVTRNEAVNLDGSHRLLHISISEEVDMLYGRKIQAVPDGARWIDSYTVPGQSVGLRFPGEDGDSKRVYTIASSPYESRRDSAYIGGCIIEVVVDKHSEGTEQRLAELAPGSVIEASQVIGRGFASLFNSYVGLPSALEEQRNLLIIAVGARGIAPARAVLSWTPIQAHATAHTVTCFYVTKSPATAAFLPEWDQWREAGICFHPLYMDVLLQPDHSSINTDSSSGNGSVPVDVAAGSSSDVSERARKEDIMSLLDQGLFLHEHGLQGAIGGRPAECTVLLAGLSGDLANAVSKELTYKGVAWERLLFCDFF
eukprot:jgi/Chrzof1/4463/Cz14g14060.t1